MICPDLIPIWSNNDIFCCCAQDSGGMGIWFWGHGLVVNMDGAGLRVGISDLKHLFKP